MKRWLMRGVPLGARLIAVLVIGGLVASVLLVRVHMRERRRVEAQLEGDLLSLVDRVAQEDEQLLERVHMLLRVVASADQIRAPSADCGAYLWGMQAQEVAVLSMSVASMDGEVICASHPLPGPLSVADRLYFQEAVREGRLTSGNFAVDRVTGRAAIHFAQPVLEEGKTRALLILALDISWLDGYARRTELPEAAVVIAWDEAGTVLASHPSPGQWVGASLADTPLFERSQQQSRGLVRMPWQDADHLWAFTSVGEEHLDRPAHVALALPSEALLAGPMRELRTALLLLWGTGLLAVAALLGLLYVWVLLPLRKLERAALSLEQGELGARAHAENAPHELGRVSAAFDAMANAFEESTRTREEFINMVAHELKTPLTTFKLQLQRLRAVTESGRLVPAPMVRQTVDAADRQVWRLNRLVESLLDSRAISEDRRPLVLQRVDLQAVVREVVDHHRPSFDAAQTPLEVEPAPAVEGVWDRALLVQLLNQLLANALKFGEGQPVTLSSSVEGDQVRLAVRDLGLGIKEEDHARVFEPFERLVPQHSHGGLGLGLWVVRQIARRMQGEVRLESRPHQGATFTVTLPRDLSTYAEAEPASGPAETFPH